MDLHAHFFEVGADFLDFLEQIVRFLLELFLVRIHIADGDGQVLGLLIEIIGHGVVAGLIAELIEARDFVLIGLAVVFEQRDLLAGGGEQVILIVKTLELVAADATLLAEEFLSLIEHGGMFGDGVRGVALLASGIVIFGIIQRPEPVFIAAVRALHGIESAAIAAVARRAAKFFLRMELQQIGIGMAGERRVLVPAYAEIGFG